MIKARASNWGEKEGKEELKVLGEKKRERERGVLYGEDGSVV